MAPRLPQAVSLFRKTNGSGTIAYKVLNERSTAVPFVLVSGLGSLGLTDWFPLSEEFAKTRPVLIFDNRGLGLSESTTDTWTMQDMANDVISLLEHLKWSEIDLLGYSMGGMIVSTVMTQPSLPFTVRHCILAATALKRGPSKIGEAMPRNLAQMSPEEQFKALVKYQKIFYDDAYPHNDIIEDKVRRSMLGNRSEKTINMQMSCIMKYDVRKLAGRFTPQTKTLVIHGKKDVAVFFGETEYTTKLIPHARLFAYPNMGHQWPDYYTTGYWVGLITSFLDDRSIDQYAPEKIDKRPRL